MHFIDEAKIFIKSGNGGNGCVSFRREKFVAKGGPDGGDGGRGADIIFVADPNLNTLLHFRYQKHFRGQNGESGKGACMSGKSRSPLVLKVPVGTQIFDSQKQVLLHDLQNPYEEFVALEGGKGGLGNMHFKSSINRAPRKATSGEVTEEVQVYLSLRVIADIGLAGLPNAGKSTFLAKVTNAKPKIADYAFSTLKPNLGVVQIYDHEFVIADIPGLIEGAHLGSGLGDKFLKHIEKCKILVHLIDATSDNLVKDYQIIRNEISNYSNDLATKIEIICLNKIDLVDQKSLSKKINALKKYTKKEIFAISAMTGYDIPKLLNQIHKLSYHENF
ncbi:GTPase CgtA [Candidatus Phycorickettsia trachydisci]|uniref:GTPase Obg n=1 Tax=Candidatus Phycorickettsia trachydisci TaxID=2115978 RepID=A0A2P1P8N8_9RICK|nr:GTPase ObgE [Candidatus Phycorickettsia trachydisci]AVP87640.1 GTPase CgtA [Candidatus Phycorickettsia trachydisci]